MPLVSAQVLSWRNVLNEAALETVRRKGDRVSRADIYNGMDRILQVYNLFLRIMTLSANTMIHLLLIATSC